ncbi:MAG: anti-sigma factor [Chloroflexota bacterium]
MRWSCRNYRALLPGYIQRELTPPQRARVSRHLNGCANCYVAYIEQKQLVHELTFSLPRVGALPAAHAPRLDSIRASVMAEMAHPKPRVTLYPARYSVVVLLLMFALLLPWSMRGQAFALPTPPQPEAATPSGTAVVAEPATDPATLTATLQANYAPSIGATDTP